MRLHFNNNLEEFYEWCADTKESLNQADINQCFETGLANRVAVHKQNESTFDYESAVPKLTQRSQDVVVSLLEVLEQANSDSFTLEELLAFKDYQKPELRFFGGLVVGINKENRRAEDDDSRQ